jgi:hypothetical protein
MASTLRPRPCRLCRKWFRPDRRVGGGQRVCSAEECQKARRKQTQAAWREANPDYWVARRLQKRGQPGEPEARRLPRPLERLPWDIAQDEFGAQGADFIGEFGRLLVEHVQDEITAQVLDST